MCVPCLCYDLKVWITPWPTLGTRPLYPGSGVHGGVCSGSFEYRWKHDVLEAVNNAVPDGNYVTGRLPSDVTAGNRTHVITREANYHRMVDRCFSRHVTKPSCCYWLSRVTQ